MENIKGTRKIKYKFLVKQEVKKREKNRPKN